MKLRATGRCRVNGTVVAHGWPGAGDGADGSAALSGAGGAGGVGGDAAEDDAGSVASAGGSGVSGGASGYAGGIGGEGAGGGVLMYCDGPYGVRVINGRLRTLGGGVTSANGGTIKLHHRENALTKSGETIDSGRDHEKALKVAMPVT